MNNKGMAIDNNNWSIRQRRRIRQRSILFVDYFLLITLILTRTIDGFRLQSRNCWGSVRHVHLAVGKDPATSMTISFSSIDVPRDNLRMIDDDSTVTSNTALMKYRNATSSLLSSTDDNIYENNNNSTAVEPIHGAILFGRSRDRMDRLVIENEEPIYYTSVQPRKLKKNYTSPYQHHITITDLKPQMTYFYRIILRNTREELKELERRIVQNSTSIEEEATNILEKEKETELNTAEESGRRLLSPKAHHRQSRIILKDIYLRSNSGHRRLAPPPYDSTQCACPDPDKIRHFRTISRAGHGKTVLAVIGDIGQFPHSEETLDHLRLNHQHRIDAIILTGDLAYPELDHRRWDTFMDLFDDYPLIEYIPMHITPGNHDIDKPEHGNNIFSAFEVRFRMPRIQEAQLGTYNGEESELNMDSPPYPLDYEYGNAYYAFQFGKTHQIYLNSYSSLDPGSKQYEWLLTELESVNRRVTPWLLLTYHVPIYNTFEVHQKDLQMFKMREHIEPLMVKYKVNIVFNGHIHAYQRTKPVAMGNVTSTGPIHIVMGAGGRNADAAFLQDQPEDWIVMRDGTIYGYGLLEIINKTHARWDWVHTGQKGDHNKVHHHPNITLPMGGADHAFFVNQYYL